MTETEIADWEREIKHAKKMQEQLRDKKKIEKANALMASLQKPIETKALADAKRNAFYAKLWVTLNSIFLLIIIYAVIHFPRG